MASYQCVLRFFFHSICLKFCTRHKKVRPGHTKCRTCHANHHSKPEDLTLQNATTLRKSARWPPNISDEHVSCAAPATRNSSLQILFKSPTPANVFETATKPSRLAHFWQGAESFAPATQNDALTFKSGANMWCLWHFDFEMCFAPQRHELFEHLNFQQSSKNGVYCTFWLRNVLRAATACTFSTSQLPKVLRGSGVFNFLTSKSSSRHNGVQFFISHLPRWLRTSRFSEPTFRPSRAPNIGKHTVFRDFSTFSHTCILFLLTLSLLWSPSFSLSLVWHFPSLLFYLSVHIVGSLTSKPPSTIYTASINPRLWMESSKRNIGSARSRPVSRSLGKFCTGYPLRQK